jgi:glycosyltransferase involved in cell wall biosynthesis
MFARELGGELHCIHYLKFRSPPCAAPKYVLQSIRTLWVLFRRAPRAVHVQNPPFLCSAVVWVYCVVARARFAVEFHSAAFGRAWRWALPVQRWLARRAAANVVTNEHWARLVRSWGGHALVMYDAFLPLPPGRPYAVGPGPTVAFLGTFADDEPVAEVLEAARLLPDVQFYVTGDATKAPHALVAGAPPNVHFTGFLEPNGEYLGLLRAVDVAIVLTTRDHTLQLAGCEAISVGTPIVTSDWPYLRELFELGAVFAAPTAESIRAGVAKALAERNELAAQTAALTALRRDEWKRQLEELDEVVSGARSPAGRVSS